uniref:Uncharacterized protein n=1 Tax=viral metagenome TaxID=1070528 RepID=A0A6H1ZXS8_9ZZZZ
MSLKSLNITSWLIFVIIYIVGLQIGDYIANMFSIAGYLATAVSLSLVFVLAAWLLSFRMNAMGWLMFILFGFVSALLGQWIAGAMAFSGIILSFITGTVLYFLLRQFTKTVK